MVKEIQKLKLNNSSTPENMEILLCVTRIQDLADRSQGRHQNVRLTHRPTPCFRSTNQPSAERIPSKSNPFSEAKRHLRLDNAIKITRLGPFYYLSSFKGGREAVTENSYHGTFTRKKGTMKGMANEY